MRFRMGGVFKTEINCFSIDRIFQNANENKYDLTKEHGNFLHELHIFWRVIINSSSHVALGNV